MSDPDAIVVGAGFAGLCAARELERQGHSVLVLEGGDRIGGRTHTIDYAQQPLELGGTWVHWYQPHVWSEISRYGLDVIEVPQHPPAVLVSSGGAVRSSAGEIAGRLEDGWTAFSHDALEAFPRPMEGWSPYLEEIDDLSIRDRLHGLGLDPEVQEFMAAQLEGGVLQALDQAGLAHMGLKSHALVSGLPELSSAVGSRFRLADGMRSLYGAIAGEIRGKVVLGAPVTAVERSASGVAVTTASGTRHSARSLVLAVPLNVLRDIALPDDLDPAKRAFIDEGHAGDAGGKLFVRLAGKVEPFTAVCPSGSPIARCKTDLPLPNGDMMVMGFGRRVGDVREPDQRAVLEQLMAALAPDAEIVDVIVQDWGQEPLFKSIWSVLRPGQIARYLREMIRPDGPIAFAGSDIAIGWNGYVDGAIESGVRAARLAAATL